MPDDCIGLCSLISLFIILYFDVVFGIRMITRSRIDNLELFAAYGTQIWKQHLTYAPNRLHRALSPTFTPGVARAITLPRLRDGLVSELDGLLGP